MCFIKIFLYNYCIHKKAPRNTEGINGNDIRTLRCIANGVHHIFHRKCLNDWLISRQTANRKCPICQTPAVPELSYKEHVIALIKGFEYQHNPFNQNNRFDLVLNLVGSTVLLLMIKLDTKYREKKPIIFNQKTLKLFLPFISIVYILNKYGNLNPDQPLAATITALISFILGGLLRRIVPEHQ